MHPSARTWMINGRLKICHIIGHRSNKDQNAAAMQLLIFGAFRSQVRFHWAKLHQGQLREGEDYALLRPTVTIVFVNEKLFPRCRTGTATLSCGSVRLEWFSRSVVSTSLVNGAGFTLLLRSPIHP